jgi:predicted ATPase
VEPDLDGVSMIKSLRLKNFKSYLDSGEIPFAPLTVIIGCNNSGKSTILQSVIALSQTLRSSSNARLVTKGDVDLGGFYDILHRPTVAAGEPITIEVTRDPLRTLPKDREAFRESTKLSLSLSFNETASRIEIERLELSDENGPVFTTNENGEWEIPGVSKTVNKYICVRLRNFLPNSFPTPSMSESAHKLDKATSDLIGKASTLIDIQAFPWSRFFYDMARIPPHRYHIPFYGGITERESDEPGHGEMLLRVLANEEEVTGTGDTLLSQVDQWTTEFNALSNLRLERLDAAGHIRSLIADDPGGANDVNVAAMGEGISQLLPIITEVVRSDRFSTVLVEQPEIHLHPALQSELADLFIKIVNLGERQLVVETHSEHLLLRLRRRIADGDIDADKVRILYVSKVNGASKVDTLRLTDSGQIDNWPKGFFDDAYQEAMALARAQSKETASNASSSRPDNRHSSDGR